MLPSKGSFLQARTMLRFRRIPRRAHWQRTPDMCTFSWLRLPRQRSASRFPSWIPIRNASMAAASRCEYSHREAAATRTRKEARLPANSRREHSLREFADMSKLADIPHCIPNWGNVCQPQHPPLLPDGKVLTSGMCCHGSPRTTDEREQLARASTHAGIPLP